MLHCLDTELDFVVDFCLPSPVAQQPDPEATGWQVGIGHVYPNCDGKKFGSNGNPSVRVGQLYLIQGLAFGGQGLGVISHPYHTQKFGTGNYSYHGSFDNDPRYLFIVRDLQHAGDNVG